MVSCIVPVLIRFKSRFFSAQCKERISLTYMLVENSPDFELSRTMLFNLIKYEPLFMAHYSIAFLLETVDKKAMIRN